MSRTFAAAVVVLIVCTAGLLADVIQGKVAKIDAVNSTLSVAVGKKTTKYTVQKDAPIFYKAVGKGKKAKAVDVADGLKGLKEGQEVMVWTEKKDGKEVVTQVRVEQEAPAKKK